MAYPSTYPTTLDSYTTKTDNVDNTMAVDVNELQSAIVAIETKLGITAGAATIAAINGGSAANDDLTLQGTSHSTRTTSYVIIQPNGGKVGIGTAAPATMLHIVGTSEAIRLQGTDAGDANTAYISFRDVNAVEIGYIGDASGGNDDIYLRASTGDLHLGDSGSGTVINLSGGKISVTLSAYANNAAAVGGGLVAGQLYRTNGDPDTVCVVH